MRKKFLLTTCIVFIIVFFSIIFLYITFATNDIQLDINSKDSILSNYEIKLDDINQPNEKILSTQNELPTITNKSEELLEKFNKKINVDKIEKIQQIYNNTLDRTTVRITFEDYKVDFDKNGNLVSYQNLNDYSTIDKDKKNYIENQPLLEKQYLINEKNDLNNIISTIQNLKNLENYKLIDCSNNVEGKWALSWCRDYGNNLLNPYESINIIVDAYDGSIMLYGENKLEPNTIQASITQDEAVNSAKTIITNTDIKSIELGCVKPNFFWIDGGPYEIANFVRLAWIVTFETDETVYVDAVSNEVLGGSQPLSTDYGRALQVVEGDGRSHKVDLASAGLSRLGYNQNGYPPVDWNITQADIDYLFSAPNLYGLYLCSHGSFLGDEHILNDGAYHESTWTKSSKGNYGNWHFVFLDACKTSTNDLWVNALHASGSGRCFVGWNVRVNTGTSYSFAKRFWPRVRFYVNR